MTTIGFLGDDLTGAGDVLAQAHRHGLEAAMVVGDAPLPRDADVVGIAGPIRSLGGEPFAELVSSGLARLAALEPDVLLYKVCSTFDSSPAIGSIGRGISLLHRQFGDHGPIAVAPAQPGFGRFTAFSDHYAAHAGTVHRLDRHPVMSVHPSTPMRDADLRRVLAAQLEAGERVGEIHLPAYDDGTFAQAWAERRRETGTAAFVVDATREEHLDAIARELLQDAAGSGPALVVGSGGIMGALARLTSNSAPPEPPEHQASGPVLAVSASASAVTAGQLRDAIEHGWADVAIPSTMLHGDDAGLAAEWESRVAEALAAGQDVVVHSTRGPGDARFADDRPVAPAHVGSLIGGLAARMAEEGLTRDIAIFGGDTSSHALIAMGVRELRVAHQFVTAGPVLRSPDPPVAGCRLLLKGGQVGPVDILRRFAGQIPHA